MAGKIMTDGCSVIINALISVWNAAGGNIAIGLFNTPHTPNIADTLATYAAIESGFPGYGRQATTPWNNAAADGAGGALTQMFVARTFTVTGANAEFAYGYFLVDTAAGLVIGAEEFPAPGPYDMSVAGTSLGLQITINEDPA